MKILMVLSSNFPPDSRVEKEATSLSKAGHHVHILCYADGRQLLTEETDHYTIHRFKVSNFFKNKLSALALVCPIYFNKWKKQILKLQKKYGFDALHIHDLPLSKTGFFFKKKFGCKLICDQHEFYSDWIKKTAHMNTFSGKIVSTLSNWEKYEKRCLGKADLIITVAEPLEENYIKKYRLPEDKIITVPNTPAKNIYNYSNVDQSIVEKYRNDFIIFYAGGIDILRGIDTAIIALNEIKDAIPNAKLMLCGKIVKPYDPFKTAEKYNVLDAIIFKGWINETELPSYIAASDVCFFIPPENRDEINKTIATKIYQYAIMGKPVIVSKAKMMKEFVETNQLGISIKSDNHNEFAEAIFKIFHKKLKIENLSGKDLFWEDTVKPLLENYRDFDN